VPRPRIAMRKIRDVLRLVLGEELSRRQVSRSLGIPLSTVNDHVARANRAGLSWPLPEGLDDAALEKQLFPPAPPSSVPRPLPEWSRVHAELRKKGVTLQLLWVEYREAHPDGYGYSQFASHYQAWRKTVDVVMRQVHRAGEKMFVDFPGMKIPIYDRRNGQVAFEAELFVACLGASSYTYAEALRSQELLHFVTANIHALEFFDGAPAICVPDNLRSAVRRADRYEPDLNATYQEFAEHYSMAIIPARPYKARDKAKVEAAVLVAERWIIARLRRRRFFSLAEANAAIWACLEVINTRGFKKMDGSRKELYETLDRPALRRLPKEPYRFATWRKAKVNIDYHVELRSDRHYYSVPYQLAGSVVELRISASSVEVFFSGRRVASHVRSFVRHGYSTDVAHMPESHRRHAQWTPSRIVTWANKTGPSTAALVSGILERRPHPEQGYRSALGIIRLAERHGAERCEAACGRALHLGAYSYKSVASILAHHLEAQPLPEPGPPPAAHPHHRNLRGGAYYR
jgi:transposase